MCCMFASIWQCKKLATCLGRNLKDSWDWLRQCGISGGRKWIYGMSGYNWKKTALDLHGNGSGFIVNALFLLFCKSRPGLAERYVLVLKQWRSTKRLNPDESLGRERDNCSTSAYSLVFHLSSASDGVNLWLECWKSLQRLKYRQSSLPAEWKQYSIQLALRVTRNHFLGKQPVHTLREMMYMENRQQATPAAAFIHSTVGVELG